MYGLLNPSTMGRMWHKNSFKQITASLSSEFSFIKTSFLIKGKEPSLPYRLPIPRWERMDSCLPHSQQHEVKRKQHRPRIEL